MAHFQFTVSPNQPWFVYLLAKYSLHLSLGLFVWVEFLVRFVSSPTCDMESMPLFNRFQAKLISVMQRVHRVRWKGEFWWKPAVAGLSGSQLCGKYAVTTLCQLRRVQAGGCLRRAGWTSKSTSGPLSPPSHPSWPPPSTPTSRGPPSSASTKTRREYRLVFLQSVATVWERNCAQSGVLALRPTDTPLSQAIWQKWCHPACWPGAPWQPHSILDSHFYLSCQQCRSRKVALPAT